MDERFCFLRKQDRRLPSRSRVYARRCPVQLARALNTHYRPGSHADNRGHHFDSDSLSPFITPPSIFTNTHSGTTSTTPPASNALIPTRHRTRDDGSARRAFARLRRQDAQDGGALGVCEDDPGVRGRSCGRRREVGVLDRAREFFCFVLSSSFFLYNFRSREDETLANKPNSGSPFTLHQILPIHDHDKGKLLTLRSPRLRLQLIAHWINSLDKQGWWQNNGCTVM